MPVYAILFGEVLGVLSKDVETARSDSIFYSFMFLVVGVVVGLAMFLQGNITIRSSKSSHQGVTSEFTIGKTFQAAQLTHGRFLTIDHSCKLCF